MVITFKDAFYCTSSYQEPQSLRPSRAMLGSKRPHNQSFNTAWCRSGHRHDIRLTWVRSSCTDVTLQLCAGGVAGVISALTGVGGGIILIPAMAKFTSLPQQAINGTSIGAVAIAASVGAYNYLESGACNVPLALTTTIPAIIATKYGVRTAHRLSSKTLSFVVGSAMLLCSPLIFLKNSSYLPKWSDRHDPLDLQFYVLQQKDLEAIPQSNHDKLKHATIAAKSAAVSNSYIEQIKSNYAQFAIVNVKYVAAGIAAGYISGLCGLGGGILITSYLTAASDMPQSTIIGTSLLSIVPTAASSTVFNLRAKSIHLPTAIRIGSSLAAGVYITSKYITHEMPEDLLRGILSSTLGAAALVMICRAL